MTDPSVLALLGLRRLRGRIAVSAGTHAAPGGGFDPTVLTGGDRVALGRVLRRAVERTWLTLELLFGRDAVAPRLGRGGPQTLDSVFGNRCFDHLTSTPAPFRQSILREVHAARKSGPLATAEVDVEDLLRQLSGLDTPADERGLQDLEWYALWQFAAGLARGGYPGLKSLLEARSDSGGSLVVGLVASFVPFDLELEGVRPPDLGPGLLPAEHLRWLCEHSEPVEVLLNEAYSGGGEAARPASGEGPARTRQGLAFCQRGDYERAVIEFTAAIQADFAAVAPYVHRGDAYRLRGEYDRAVADYTQALRLDAENLAAYLNRGLVHRLLGKPDAAVADLTEAIRIDPRNVLAHATRGSAWADLGKFEAAVADHTQAIQLDPSLAWAYQSRGDAHAGCGRYDLAIADYSQALRLNPHFPLAYANRADAYRLSGDHERAAADYTEAIRLDPLNPRTYLSRGEARRRQGQFDLALADYAEAIRLDPTNPAGYLNRGITHQAAGDYDLAVADFDRAEQFDAANPALFYQRALAYQHQKSYEQAIADLGRAIELNPRDAGAFIARGSLYARADHFDLAIEDLTEAVRLDPTSAQARLERGRVLAQSGQYAEAVADCGEALALAPDLVPALVIRGTALMRLGDYAPARDDLTRAIRINPRYAKAHNDLGVVHSLLGEFEHAVADFTRAIELQSEYVQALSNRANAYQFLNRPDLALRDATRAVVLDAKYAALYCVQRGLVEASRGNARQALADYAVALSIEPNNRAARAAREEALAHAESEFEVNLEPEAGHPGFEVVETPPARPARMTPSGGVAYPEPRRLVRGDAEKVEDTEDTEGSGVPGEEETGSETESFDIELAEEPDDEGGDAGEETVPGSKPEAEVTLSLVISPEDAAAAEAEAKKMREAAEKARLEELAAKAAEIRKKNEEAEAKRKAEESKAVPSGRRVKEDPEEVAERWKKRKQTAVIAFGAVFLLYWGAQLVMALIPPPKNPYPTFTSDEFLGLYAKDATGTDDKYADKVVVLRGKLTVVREKAKRGVPTPPAKLYFAPAGESELKAELLFDDPDVVEELKDGSDYVISGKVQRYKPGSPIQLKACNVMHHLGESASAPRVQPVGHRGFAARSDADEGRTRLRGRGPVGRLAFGA